MKTSISDWLLLATIVGIVVAGSMLVGSPAQRQLPKYEIGEIGNWIELQRGEGQTIHIRPKSITSFTRWENHPSYGPSVTIRVAGTEYHIDCDHGELDDISTFLVNYLTEG